MDQIFERWYFFQQVSGAAARWTVQDDDRVKKRNDFQQQPETTLLTRQCSCQISAEVLFVQHGRTALKGGIEFI